MGQEQGGPTRKRPVHSGAIRRTRHRFYRHLARNLVVAAVMVAGSLGIGAAGYHFTENLPWLDALLNAAMILTGMGPVDKVQSDAGKIFATGYALFAGMVFLSTAALVLMPLAHRILHRFHLELAEETDTGTGKQDERPRR